MTAPLSDGEVALAALEERARKEMPCRPCEGKGKKWNDAFCRWCLGRGYDLDFFHLLLATALAASEERVRLLEGAAKVAPDVISILRDFGIGDPSYGAFVGGDPRNFTPDPDASTEAERKRHAEACEAWERGETPDHRDRGCGFLRALAGEVDGHLPDGRPFVVSHYGETFGLGTNRDPAGEAMIDALRRLAAALEGR